MSGTLYVVATPIGNLEDVTLRALRVLREVSIVAAEDTRRTARLLQHYGIATPTIAFHEHSGPARVRLLIERLVAGESVAVVSDAGTPGVSDPGYELIRAAREHHIPIDPVPGPSAVLAALVASGFPMDHFTFLGFAPSRANARKQWLQELSAMEGLVVFFEAPHRIVAMLADLVDVCGNRPICVAREVTKVHQEFLVGVASEVLDRLAVTKGEFTIVLGPRPRANRTSDTPPSDVVIAKLFGHKTETTTGSRRSVIRDIATELGVSAKAVYEAIERHKHSVEQQN